jgi:hypothetical protein
MHGCDPISSSYVESYQPAISVLSISLPGKLNGLVQLTNSKPISIHRPPLIQPQPRVECLVND